jgi:hypothetical protein
VIYLPVILLHKERADNLRKIPKLSALRLNGSVPLRLAL